MGPKLSVCCVLVCYIKVWQSFPQQKLSAVWYLVEEARLMGNIRIICGCSAHSMPKARLLPAIFHRKRAVCCWPPNNGEREWQNRRKKFLVFPQKNLFLTTFPVSLLLVTNFCMRQGRQNQYQKKRNCTLTFDWEKKLSRNSPGFIFVPFLCGF